MTEVGDFDFLVLGLFRASLENIRIAAERIVNDSFGPAESKVTSMSSTRRGSMYDDLPLEEHI